MNVKNWQHNSGKPPKRKLKPQALRSAREKVKHFKKCHMTSWKRGVSYYYRYIRNKVHGSQAGNQITTC